MSKLWIVHRNPRPRNALVRSAGLGPQDLSVGGPASDLFQTATPPAALILGLEGDFERELDFLHRHRTRLTHTRLYLLTAPENADEARRLFEGARGEVLETIPSDRALRALVLSAVAHRNAETLADRRDRERIAQRFSGWFGSIEIPGLLRALDPALARLPLLVRGVEGSGRALVARYVELFRRSDSAPLRTLRVHARELQEIDDLAARIRARRSKGPGPIETVWIDEVDALSTSAQIALAEWIRLDTAPTAGVGGPLRWIATAGPRNLHDRLESALENALAPLSLGVPSLADHPESVGVFARQIADEWREAVGDVPREIGDSAVAALEAFAWSGDRAAIESLLRTTFASTTRSPIEESDLVAAQASADLSPAAAARPEATPPQTPTVPATPTAPTAPATLAAPTPSITPPIPPPDFIEAEPLPVVEAVFESDPAAGTATGAGAGAVAGTGTAESAEQRFVSSDATVAPPTAPFATSPEAADIADFERAFLEGLPLDQQEATEGGAPGHDSDPSVGARVDAAEDVSLALTEEAFGLADEAARAGGHAGDGSQSWRRLARSLSHEIRNPLVSIRTFAQLLPDHFADASFRERFTDLVGRDVNHIDEVVSRLADAAAADQMEAKSVDVSALLERLLDERREQIGEGRLLVLRELERDAPNAWVDDRSLEVALAGLLDRALASLPERGDLFVATRHLERAADGTPRLRILMRHHNPDAGGGSHSGLEEVSTAANVLEYVLAETVVEANGGTLTIDSTDAQETLILVDLRTRA